MDAFNSEAFLFQLLHLIVHQCYERTDHESSSTSCQSWQLVTKRLARAGRHDKQRVFSRGYCPTDGFLVGAKVCEAERVLQKLGETRVVEEFPWTGETRRIGSLCGCGSRRCKLKWRNLTNLVDNRTHVLTDAIQERRQLGFTELNLLEKGLPLAGHRGTFDFGMNHFYKMDPLFRCLQTLPRTNDIATLQ